MVADFTNKVVLVTGASAGIGEAIALLFAKLGANLAIVGRDAGNLGSVAKRCQAEKGLAPLAIVADLQRLTDYNEKQYQDWLKNASGSIPLGRVCSGEDIAKMVAHLASDELSPLVTGTVVEVDGGMRFGNIGGLVQSYAK